VKKIRREDEELLVWFSE